uniref:cysteine desulfurase family protein n=1 Tax=Anatilimnocola floriformis TaxID=2948575 RepID=UPI0036F25C32
MQLPIYLDNHATTRVDPRVVDAMLPFFTQIYGNAGSTSHSFGWEAKAAADDSRARIAAAIGANEREIIFTSGATESNNLAIRGTCERNRRRGNHIVSVTTEHKAVLDPLKKLARKGFEVTLLPVTQIGDPLTGILKPEQVAAALREETCLVSVMLANNEIGSIAPISEIGAICRERGIPFQCDATQAVGKIPVDVSQLNVDLMSFSAHKMYGPKGIGALYVRRGTRLEGQIDGGGQEYNLRSGTLPVPLVVGFAAALDLCLQELPAAALRQHQLRERLFQQLKTAIPDCLLNGPELPSAEDLFSTRLPGNLNLAFPLVQGEALMMSMRDVAVSSGSACTSANPEPSHVLRAIGQTEDLTLASLRFGIGRFNTAEEIDFAARLVIENVRRLRELSSLAQ